MAPWIAVMMILVLCVSRVNVAIAREYLRPVDHVLILWAMLSCIWSISPIESIVTFSQLVFTILLAHVIINKINLIVKGDQSFVLKMVAGIVLAVIIFLVDKYTDGMIYRATRSILQPESTNQFHLPWLDRGCCVLALSTWALIYLLVKSRQFLAAFCLYVVIFTILSLSDSTSALLGFIIAGIAYVALYFGPKLLSLLLAWAVVIYMTSMPIFAIVQNPYSIAAKYESIPISYAHRLFIWKFTVDKSMENPILGKGIGTSRSVEVLESDMVNYRDLMISPLPRHPHNNILQIWLEMGLVGMAIAIYYIWNILGKFRNIAIENRNFGAIIHAVFINYFFIGMISFNMWQSWWLMVALFMVLLMNIVRKYE
jgi:O-antigen ligase